MVAVVVRAIGAAVIIAAIILSSDGCGGCGRCGRRGLFVTLMAVVAVVAVVAIGAVVIRGIHGRKISIRSRCVYNY